MSSLTAVDCPGPFEVKSRSTKEAELLNAAKLAYGSAYHFWAKVDDQGRPSLAQVLRVVETVRDERREVALHLLQRTNPSASLGDHVVNPLDVDAIWLCESASDTAVSNVMLTVA